MVLVRGKGPGRAILDALIDLPFVVSPAIAGLALILVYGQDWVVWEVVRPTTGSGSSTRRWA